LIRVIPLPKLFETLGRVAIPSLPENRAKGAKLKRTVG
jgi:hypothetical protein